MRERGRIVGGWVFSPLRVGRPAALPVLLAGSLGRVGNGLWVVAAQGDRLALLAVIAGLFPASTVILARLVLAETFTPARLTGLTVALAAVAMITAAA